MMFDSGKMKPLFKLEIGKPGSSFAIDIARQIGLPNDILDKAASNVGEDHINFDKHLREILRDKRYWEEKRDRIRISEKRLASMLEQYETELGQTKKMRKEILETAQKEAAELLSNVNKEIEKTIRVIRETQADKDLTKEARKNLEDYRKNIPEDQSAGEMKLDGKIGEIRKQVRKLRGEPLETEKPAEARESNVITAGDVVFIKNLGTRGDVLEINGENALVTYGESMITSVKLSNLEKQAVKGPRSSQDSAKPARFDWSLSQRKLNFKPDIDIRGKRGEEAVDLVRRLVDDATVVGVSELRILHGKGNGILKNMVREYLTSLDIVRSCRDEHVERGGAGITLVTLDF
jgi:DNA mismatch repair protein MutS2